MGQLASTTPLLSIEEFLADTLGLDTTKNLKCLTTLQATANIGAVSISVVSKQGTAPASLNPLASQIPTFAVLAGDPVWIGTGTPTDPYELVFATGGFTGGGPYALAITATSSAHAAPSRVSIGSVQQSLLTSTDAAERFCRQPLGLTTHPSAEWPRGAEFRLGTPECHVDRDGSVAIFLPYQPIVTVTSFQYRTVANGAWTSIDAPPLSTSPIEQLVDKLLWRGAGFIRGQIAYFKVGWTSGYALNAIPDDVKEAIRKLTVAGERGRGGQAVRTEGGKTRAVQVGGAQEKDPYNAQAEEALWPFRSVR